MKPAPRKQRQKERGPAKQRQDEALRIAAEFNWPGLNPAAVREKIEKAIRDPGGKRRQAMRARVREGWQVTAYVRYFLLLRDGIPEKVDGVQVWSTGVEGLAIPKEIDDMHAKRWSSLDPREVAMCAWLHRRQKMSWLELAKRAEDSARDLDNVKRSIRLAYQRHIRIWELAEDEAGLTT